MHKILAYFQSADPILFAAYIPNTVLEHPVSKAPFLDLVDAVICQQLSDKAGSTISSRFRMLFSNREIDPSVVCSMPISVLRTCGISENKAKYIHGIAESFVSGEINSTLLRTLSDEEVITSLTTIRGIGRWTAEMFLMFSLGREDVFSFGDLGLQKAVQKLYGYPKKPTIGQLRFRSNKWRPFRTAAAKILWASLQNR